VKEEFSSAHGRKRDQKSPGGKSANQLLAKSKKENLGYPVNFFVGGGRVKKVVNATPVKEKGLPKKNHDNLTKSTNARGKRSTDRKKKKGEDECGRRIGRWKTSKKHAPIEGKKKSNEGKKASPNNGKKKPWGEKNQVFYVLASWKSRWEQLSKKKKLVVGGLVPRRKGGRKKQIGHLQ